MVTLTQTIKKRKTQERCLVLDKAAGYAHSAYTHAGRTPPTAPAAEQEHSPPGNAQRRGARSPANRPADGRATRGHHSPSPAEGRRQRLGSPAPPRDHAPVPATGAASTAPRTGPAHGPALAGSARTLPAHAQGDSSAHTPLRADGCCPAPAFPPSRPPGGWFLPRPIISSPSQQYLPPLRENTRPTNMAADKTARAAPSPRPPRSAPPRAASPPARLAPGLLSPPRPPSLPCPPRPALPPPVSVSPRRDPPAPGPAAPTHRPLLRLHSRCGSRRSAADRPPTPPLRPTLRPV
ncbi:uncharacterized protein [Nyctibius grandis]|uniref:uncharacterized protein n=1 Tax=Nyctibius grandis TaxID=48427 RepID=UPI0035BC8B5D